MTAEYGDPLLDGVAAGSLSPEQALLAGVLRRARMDAQGSAGRLPGGPRNESRETVRVRLSAEAQAWMQTDEYRAALVLLDLEAREC